MQHLTQMEWEILEAEAEEWAHRTSARHADEYQPRGWSRAASLIATVTIVAMLAMITSHRVQVETETSAAAIHREVGALVQVESLHEYVTNPATQEEVVIESIARNASGVMVRAAVTKTLPMGHVLVRKETRFYRPFAGGWQRTAPLHSFWGRATALDTATIHFDFHELDRPYVAAVAEPLTTFHGALRQLLGLPALAPSARITVSIVPEYVAPGEIIPDRCIVQPSSLLFDARPDEELDALLYARLRHLMIAQTMQEAVDQNHVKAAWLPLVAHLQVWIQAHGDHLPLLVEMSDPSTFLPHADRWLSTYRFTTLFVDDVEDYAQGYQVYRNQSVASAAQSFFDFLVFNRGPSSIARLLAAFGTADTWPAVIEEVFGMTLEEILLARASYVPTSNEIAPGKE
ncbi:MAG: hypothetical protein IPM07_25240 [Anaerolineales bacterium]|nr:hypothetical protein [Anaerolineales bacterium]